MLFHVSCVLLYHVLCHAPRERDETYPMSASLFLTYHISMGGSPGDVSEELCSFSKPFRHFTYVTAHSPTLPSLYLRHNSFSNSSVGSSTSQFILQPFLDEIDASFERTPTKSIPKLAQQVGISESSAQRVRASKLLKLKPYKCSLQVSIL